jgi:hypothetical protein
MPSIKKKNQIKTNRECECLRLYTLVIRRTPGVFYSLYMVQKLMGHANIKTTEI